MSKAVETTTEQSSSRHLVRNLLELGELQVQLLRADASAAGKATRTAAILVAVAICLLLAATPVLLLSLAAWIESAFELSQAASLGLAGGGGAALAAILLLIARSSVNRGLSMLSQTVDELVQNIECVKRALSGQQDAADPNSKASRNGQVDNN